MRMRGRSSQNSWNGAEAGYCDALPAFASWDVRAVAVGCVQHRHAVGPARAVAPSAVETSACTNFPAAWSSTARGPLRPCVRLRARREGPRLPRYLHPHR